MSRCNYLVDTVENYGAHEVAKICALVRFHYPGVNPDELTDEQLGLYWGELQYCLEIEKMRNGLKAKK